MKNQIKLILILAIAFTCNYSFSQAADVDKKSALVFVEDGEGTPASGRIYASSARGASRVETETLMMPLETLEIGLLI